jgi:hypothetical protein
MRGVKSVFGVIGALVPVLWFGGLAYYFYGTNQAMGGAAASELGPTIIGLGAIGILFCIPVVWKIIKAISGSSGAKPARTIGTAAEAESDFDADAALARYLARKNAEPGAPPLWADTPPPRTADPVREAPAAPPAARPTFGRKIA